MKKKVETSSTLQILTNSILLLYDCFLVNFNPKREGSSSWWRSLLCFTSLSIYLILPVTSTFILFNIEWINSFSFPLSSLYHCHSTQEKDSQIIIHQWLGAHEETNKKILYIRSKITLTNRKYGLFKILPNFSNKKGIVTFRGFLVRIYTRSYFCGPLFKEVIIKIIIEVNKLYY